MNRRPGITLIEVLAAIFIAGIGLMALLTLFPLGALEMAQSIQDDRMGHIKHSAASTANATDLRKQQQVLDGMLNPSAAGGSLPSFYLPGTTTVDPNFPGANSASYPVIVDPIGYNFTTVPANRDWLAGATGIVPRRVYLDPVSPGGVPAGENLHSHTLHWMALLDDIRFLENAVPTAGAFERNYNYSWAYLCKMPKASAGIVELTVIIYKGRALDSDATSGESAYAADYYPGNNTVVVTWPAGQTPPDIRPGSWVLDGTMQPDPRGYFYRVLSATQLDATTMEIEVQQPLKAGGPGGVLVIMDGVIGVFERGTY